MSTGLKVWLWIVLVLNAIIGLLCIPLALLVPVLWVSVILEVILIVGVCMLLFKQKKMGFYILIGTSVLNLIINVVGGQGIVKSLISAILFPLITYALMRSSWDQFE